MMFIHGREYVTGSDIDQQLVHAIARRLQMTPYDVARVVIAWAQAAVDEGSEEAWNGSGDDRCRGRQEGC
jgi:hypothetical protein